MSQTSRAAALLGRKGGRANTDAQHAARARNAQYGGRPSLYRLIAGVLERRQGARWLTLHEPYDAAAKAYLRRAGREAP